jgi:hypothetical protein
VLAIECANAVPTAALHFYFVALTPDQNQINKRFLTRHPDRAPNGRTRRRADRAYQPTAFRFPCLSLCRV